MKRHISHYEIIEKLGAGGMGEVYLARDRSLERTVALKVLPAEVAADQTRMRRFQQEAKATSALNHPNILTIYEIGETDSAPFIAAEFIDGETLRQRTAREPLRLADALDISIQVADALAAAHDEGIVHRDIKPENIMLRRRDGYVKVLDFGLAKLAEEPKQAVDTSAPTRAQLRTEPGVVMGTAAYMSPEQARGLPVDTRTDVWSLGCVIYEMVAGRPPFEGATRGDVLASILGEREPQPLARYSREVPPELERIVSKALRRNRDERYQTVKDLLLDLRSLKRELEFEAKLERTTPPASFAAKSVSTASDAETVIEPQAQGTAAPASLKGDTAPASRKRRILVVAIVAAVVIAAAAYYLFLRGKPPIDSVAILPFSNAGGDPETEYLSDGITESLINNLSQLPNLRMIARGSVFRYKGKEVDPQAVGRELGVRAVLMGRVTQRGDNLTVSVELIDTGDNTHLWGETFNRKLSDLLALQGELSKDISEKLRLRLTGAEAQQLTRRQTENTEAYQLYLKGRFYTAKATEESLRRALEFYNEALEKDPGYALVYAGIAGYYWRISNLYMPSKEALPRAKAAAIKARDLDDTLAEAHAWLGITAAYYDWDWAAAEREFKRALALNPNLAQAHSGYGGLLSLLGRHDEAIAELRRSSELDPLSPGTSGALGLAFYRARRFDESVEQFRKMIEINPGFWLAHLYKGRADDAKGSFNEAIEELQQARKLNDHPWVLANLVHAYAGAGKRSEALGTLEELKAQQQQQRFVNSYSFVLAYTGLGDKERAFEWLQKTIEDHSEDATSFNSDPQLDPLRSDPRFSELLRRVGL